MKKATFLTWLLTSVLCLSTLHVSLAADFDIQKYVGWWEIENPVGIPHHYLEIVADDGGTVYVYNAAKEHLFTGTISRNTGKELPKDDAIALNFAKYGLLGGTLIMGDNNQRKLDVTVVAAMPKVPFLLLEKAPFATQRPKAIAVKDAGEHLMKIVGKHMEGMAFRETGKEDIKGIMCTAFSIGNNTPERFVTLHHVAVCPKGQIYVLDVAADNWEIYAGFLE